MIIHGSIADNLTAAIRSSRRLRGSPVHSDTIAFWRQLLAKARAEEPPANPAQTPSIEQLADQLEAELALIDQR
jgi:hypothetical protein